MKRGRLIELGYRQGGPAGFGLRRVLIGENGERKAELARGEHKSLQTDRVVLTPGPAEEVEIVRDIYRQFIEDGKPESRIAADLNARGINTDLGRNWTSSVVHQILTNEKYIGNHWPTGDVYITERQCLQPQILQAEKEACGQCT